MGDLGAAFTPSGWPAFVLISARLTGMVMVAPFFSMFGIPRTVRGGIVVVLALTLLPAAPHPAFPERALDIPVPLMTELVIGLGIGMPVAAVIQHALVPAAEVVSPVTGLSLGQLFTA
ncbi:MAG: flagellar biosynthetic protein FliR [Gemmatimonadales bacterium]